MTSRRAFIMPLALAPAAAWAVWRLGAAEPETAGGAVDHGGGLHLGSDPAAALWRELMRAKRDGGAMTPAAFPETVAALDGREVTLRGFMAPLQEAPAHRRFLFAPNPPGCPGCRPLEAFSLLDVRAAAALPMTPDPVLLRGALRLRRYDDLPYRLDSAVAVPV